MISEFIIWNSSLDLSPAGVAEFCETKAAAFGKTPEELKSMPLLDLAAKYMWSARSDALRVAKETLNFNVGVPLVVFSDVIDFMKRRTECTLLDSENLQEIFECRRGLSTKFFTDGLDLRCEDLTEDGMNHHLFRAVKDPRALGECARACSTEQRLPSREELDRCSTSLAPVIDRLYGRSGSQRLEQYIQKRSKPREKEYQR